MRLSALLMVCYLSTYHGELAANRAPVQKDTTLGDNVSVTWNPDIVGFVQKDNIQWKPPADKSAFTSKPSMLNADSTEHSSFLPVQATRKSASLLRPRRTIPMVRILPVAPFPFRLESLMPAPLPLSRLTMTLPSVFPELLFPGRVIQAVSRGMSQLPFDVTYPRPAAPGTILSSWSIGRANEQFGPVVPTSELQPVIFSPPSVLSPVLSPGILGRNRGLSPVLSQDAPLMTSPENSTPSPFPGQTPPLEANLPFIAVQSDTWIWPRGDKTGALSIVNTEIPIEKAQSFQRQPSSRQDTHSSIRL